MEKMVVVYGSHGKLFADPVNGAILKRQGPHGEKEFYGEHGGNNGICDECRETEIAYAEIDYFDFKDITVPIKWEIVIENGKALEVGHMDIARVGYTLNNGEYLKPSTIFAWNAFEEKSS
tara:strand:+ start:3590 stop:3949 length:360 start_codon:yes stop_codon:yes gene_type:complete